jgi:hypothetical protein
LVRDAAGLPVWAEAGYVPNNILPGQSSAFTLTLPPARSIEVLADIDPATHEINGSSVAGLPPGIPAPGATAGTIPLDGKAGYGSVRLETSSMTFDPEF